MFPVERYHRDFHLVPRTVFAGVILLSITFLVSHVRAGNVLVSPAGGPANAIITLTSSGFLPDATGTNWADTGFYVDNGLRATCPAFQGADSANCSVQFRAPTGAGPHGVKASNSFGESATNTYTVATASFSVVPNCGPAGTPLTATGHNYPADWSIGIYIDGAYSGQNAFTGESGDFTINFPMPAMGPGTHIIAGKDSVGDTNFGTFTISTDCIGTAQDMTGSATVTHPDGTTEPLVPGMGIQMGDTIQTGAKSRTSLYLIDGTQYILSENTKLTMDIYTFDPNNNSGRASYNIFSGSFQYVSGLLSKNPNPDVQVETPVGNIGIRGTEFIARRDPCSATQEIYLIEGELAVTPLATGVTNIVDAPISIFLSASNVSTSSLAQATYDSISNQLRVTGPVTFDSWQVQYFGCTNGNPDAAADADPDHDGQNNFAEFLAGTDPTTNASCFRIVSAIPTGNNLRITWSCGGGRTNVLQSAGDLAGAWANVSPDFVLPNPGDVSTNYLDIGAITNAPTRYYRVRLVP
jgi:hypothetical protein